jgi:predicted metal-dependent peptidase
MSEENYQLPPQVEPTYEQAEAMVEARIAFMRDCPFFSYVYLDKLVEYYTYAVSTLATDSRRVFINPDYLMGLKPMERAFALAHETYHAVQRHPERAKYYREQGHVDGVPFDPEILNKAMDYPINADLIENKVGSCNPSWLYSPDIKGDEMFEDVYKKLYSHGGVCPPPPPRQPGTGQPQPGTGNGKPQPATYGDTHKGGRPDKTANDNDGRFDTVLEPYQDPVSGKQDLPSEMEFRESIARAAAAAEAIGKMPGSFKRVVDKILEPQVQWRDELRLIVVGKLGASRETWNTPNRRRIVLHPMVYLPGRRGWGANDITVVVDNSGSISEKQLMVFFGEVSAIINDCKPKLVRVIWADAEVRRVEEARNLDELVHIREEGSAGGGGTDFRPPFEWLAERDIRPDTLLYFTDCMGTWPTVEPKFDVIWCSTSKDIKPPFGKLVEIGV